MRTGTGVRGRVNFEDIRLSIASGTPETRDPSTSRFCTIPLGAVLFSKGVAGLGFARRSGVGRRRFSGATCWNGTRCSLVHRDFGVPTRLKGHARHRPPG